jgi:hypothetical protein
MHCSNADIHMLTEYLNKLIELIYNSIFNNYGVLMILNNMIVVCIFSFLIIYKYEY